MPFLAILLTGIFYSRIDTRQFVDMGVVADDPVSRGSISRSSDMCPALFSVFIFSKNVSESHSDKASVPCSSSFLMSVIFIFVFRLNVFWLYVPPMEKDDVLSCGEDRVWRVSMCALF